MQNIDFQIFISIFIFSLATFGMKKNLNTEGIKSVLSSLAKITATFSIRSSRKKNNATSLQSGAYIFLSQRRKNGDYLFTPT